MVGLEEMYMDYGRVIKNLFTCQLHHRKCGWGFIETRRPCKGYPKKSFWQRIRSNPMRRNYRQDAKHKNAVRHDDALIEEPEKPEKW